MRVVKYMEQLEPHMCGLGVSITLSNSRGMELLGSRSEMLTTMHWRGEMGELWGALEWAWFLAGIVQQVRKPHLFLWSPPAHPSPSLPSPDRVVHSQMPSLSARW